MGHPSTEQQESLVREVVKVTPDDELVQALHEPDPPQRDCVGCWACSVCVLRMIGLADDCVIGPL